MERRASPWIFLVFLFGSRLAFGDECPVTRGEGMHQNDAIAVVLPPDGKFVFRPYGPGFIDSDGALGMKIGWQVKIRGLLHVTGRRLDGPAPPARGYTSYRTGDPGGQSNFTVFPTPGCWEMVASVADQSLKFVVAVELVDSGPAGRMNGVPRGWRQTGG